MDSLYSRFLEQVQAKGPALDDATDFVDSFPENKLVGVIGICLEDPLCFSLSFLRVLGAGATPVIMPTPEELRSLRIRRVIDEQGLRAGPEIGNDLLEPRSEAFYAFSSGSTGVRRPLAVDCHRALANARAHAASLGIGETSRIVQTLRIHHSFGVVAYILTPLVTGARVEMGVYFDSLFASKSHSDKSNFVVHLTPYHLQFLMRRRVRPQGRIGKLTIGAGPLRRVEALYAVELCRDLYTTYGLSEAGPRVSTGKVDPETFVDGWIGYVLEGVEARVAEESCLWLRTPFGSLDRAREEYFNTGDCVERRADGSFIFKNRQNDVLRIRGQTYSRTFYNHKLDELVGLPCQVAQRDYSDDLLVFIESDAPQTGVVDKIHRHFPELREVRVVWLEHFDRSVLGKVDLRRMMARFGDAP